MKKYSILIILFVIGCSQFYAQEAKHSKALINLGLWRTLSTNGKDTDFYTNNFSLNLGVGESENLYGIAISGLANFNMERGCGISIAGFYNDYVTHSGLMTAFYNRVETMHGIQIGIFNNSDEAYGLQIGFNSSKNLNGLQIGINNAENLKGVQIGMANNSKINNGLQIGGVNFAETQNRGVQIGLVNVAKKNNYPVGLVNIIESGEMSVRGSWDETMNFVTTFRSGGKYLYGLVGLGYNFRLLSSYLSLEFGIGGHIHITPKLTIDSEIAMTYIGKSHVEFGKDNSDWPNNNKRDDDDHDYKIITKTSLRILPSYKISNRISVFAGPSLSYMLTHDADNEKIFPSHYMWRKFDNSSMKQLYVGYSFGIQYNIK